MMFHRELQAADPTVLQRACSMWQGRVPKGRGCYSTLSTQTTMQCWRCYFCAMKGYLPP